MSHEPWCPNFAPACKLPLQLYNCAGVRSARFNFSESHPGGGSHQNFQIAGGTVTDKGRGPETAEREPVITLNAK